MVTRLLNNGEGLVFDLRSKLDRKAKPSGIELWRL
jgi:UDP-N-acetyl-D-glucosamine/UDP-N-acetyl-D-galactosamine dehydrogenase